MKQKEYNRKWQQLNSNTNNTPLVFFQLPQEENDFRTEKMLALILPQYCLLKLLQKHKTSLLFRFLRLQFPTASDTIPMHLHSIFYPNRFLLKNLVAECIGRR